ncbi:MAG: hypothetical protein GEU28_02325 [Dehalococcoidia bacterium]|nr:hypothetical protein [Dehalococcoidia bacterium]
MAMTNARTTEDGAQADGTLFGELLRIRDEQRKERESAIWLIKGKDLPWEVNQHGKMKWYLHPQLKDIALKTMLFYKQEIAGGSRSGRQQCQGSIIFYILRGQGYTLLDGVKHPWTAGDFVNLPIREEGIVYQHFNADAKEPVEMIGCEPNLIEVLGVDKGCGFEELEVAPEYREQKERP